MDSRQSDVGNIKCFHQSGCQSDDLPVDGNVYVRAEAQFGILRPESDRANDDFVGDIRVDVLAASGMR